MAELAGQRREGRSDESRADDREWSDAHWEDTDWEDGPGGNGQWKDEQWEDGRWVDAAPFRAHLRHLMAVGSLTAAEVATLVGISGQAANRLLTGRAGRPLRRISPVTASRLLKVSAAEVRGLRWCWAPAAPAVRHLRQLRLTGWSDRLIADRVGVSAAELAALDAGAQHCSRLLTLRLATARQTVDAARPHAAGSGSVRAEREAAA